MNSNSLDENSNNNNVLSKSTGSTTNTLSNSTNNFIAQNNNANYGDWVKLNVGGTIIQTTITTLRKDKDSMLNLMFNKEYGWNHCRDENGCILIDADPRYFLVILNYLRHGDLIVEPNLNYYGVWSLAKYFQLKAIVDYLEIEENDATSWLTLLEDNVVSPDLDITKWVINRECTNSSFEVEDGRFKFQNRAYLITRDQYNPEEGEIRLTGTWCRSTNDDFFQLATRSDGLHQGPPYYEIQSGLEFNYCRGVASIVGRGGLLPSGAIKIKKQSEFSFPANVPVHFEVCDNGTNVSFTLWESITKTSISIETTCTNSSLINYIVFHNREKTGANHCSYLSNVRIQRWARPTPRRSKTKKLLKKMNQISPPGVVP
ncbi:hypothetical protein PPL_05284 [Heterostelium album PN500]|uniref:BTB domain-containing protein n=1 Tax=Heterostelium pallidum (strain ATCC 26659 / Pp 5 / PN500) TaxID=670386 RepID=D3BB98_HETP5|nr:hypothetical protein PPL_05284 [Heterostelium album PN500]EFA81305.1 hypothetical protein PPL_05284 [Heterostelium album PN500]|eukprot:XP_020433423.1 hypothetical protein PPL_05284 [Heterostelium album PN500]